MVTITAVLMIRNEAKTIQRTLASVIPHVDNIVVVDTGSTDETRVLAINALQGAKAEWFIEEHPWVDYATSRNAALELARKEFGSAHDHWLFMVDGDSELQVIQESPPVRGGWLRQKLNDSKEAAHSVNVRLRDLDLMHIRLFRASEPWAYRFPVHELVEHAGGCHSWPMLGGIRIRMLETDWQDKPRQWAAHEVLIRKYLMDHPDDPRMTFYLAQTLQCLGRTVDASIEYWQRYCRGAGSQDEKWEAGLRWATIAKTYPDIPEMSPDHDIRSILEALTHQRPWRAEAWYELAHYWAEKEDWGKAGPYATLAENLEPSDFDRFMIREDVYRYRASFLAAIIKLKVGHIAGAEMRFHEIKEHLTPGERLIWNQEHALAMGELIKKNG